MAEIAEQAGVSRQLLYFHFDGRVDLFLELSRKVDVKARSPQLQDRIDSAPDGVRALRRAIALQGHIKPQIAGIARAVDRLRNNGDAAAAAAWNERERERLARCVQLAQRLDSEGILTAGWTVQDAARMIWTTTSQRAWQELVGDGPWSTRRWVTKTTELLVAALVESASHISSA